MEIKDEVNETIYETPGIATSSKKVLVARCLITRNKKLLATRASLLVTRSY